jgi:1-acyl-sn-glycerol-3-phosphate acyltransferase
LVGGKRYIRVHPRTPWAYIFCAWVLRPLLVLITNRKWSGRENIPRSGGFIVAANHISNLDFLAMVHVLYNWAGGPKVLAKESLLKAPVIGALMRGMGQIPVYRGSSKAGGALRDAAVALERGECVLIYPEGTITRDPKGWPMRGHPGAVRLALDTGVPLIPAAQWGAQQLLPLHSVMPRLFPRPTLQVTFGPPLDLSDLAAMEDRTQAARIGTDRLMARITAMVAELRGGTPPEHPFNQFAPQGGGL